MAVAALPVAAVLAKPGLKVRSLSRWLRPLLIAGGAGVITVAAWLLPVASQAFLIWVFGYNSATLGPGLTAMAQANEARILTYFVRDHLAVTVATLLSVVALFAGRRRRLLTAVMAGWLLMSVGVISLLRPMWEHYLLLPLLPAAGLIGGGGALAIAWIAAEMRAATATAETAPRPPATASRWRAVWAAMGAVALVLVGTQFAKAPHKRPPWPAEDLALRHYLESQTPPGAFVLTDQPLVAFISGRLVPPPLADTSAKRVSTRSMDTAAVMNALLRYDPACLAFAYGRLNRLQPLVAWAEAHATEVVMPDDPFSGLRVFRLTPVGKPAVPLDVQVGAVMRLIGYRLGAAGAEQADGIVPAGEPLSVTLYWQVGDVRLTKAPEARAADPGAGQAPNGAAGADREKPRADAHIFIHIVNAAGDIVAQADAPPMDGALRTVDLEPGVVVPLAVGPVELAPGRYTVRAGMYTWPDQVRLPAVLGSGEKAPDDLIPVAALQVVGP